MEKQTKISFGLLALSIVLAVLHNALYGLIGIEEPVFFSLTLLLALAFVISLAYNIFTYSQKGKPKDLWKIGWLGLLGLIGLLPRFGPGFYGLYGFFGFFGLKKNKFKQE